MADGPTVAVLGAAGYAGAIAASLLHRHPSLALAHVTARAEAGRRLDDVHPRTRVPLTLEAFDPDTHGDVDAAVVGYPHGASAPAVAALRERGVKVVDLSADFRLHDRATYEDWYGEHGAPGLFGQGVYGLPELHRDDIAGADLVANPGCYPTAALLALAPLARAGAIADVVIDAKSGVSGAGRSATDTTHFVSANENVLPYKVGSHRHTPEIEQELAGLGAEVMISFTPHLVPLSQGELVSAYVTPSREVDAAALFAEAYAEEPWVEVAAGPPGTADVMGTNGCRISVHPDPRTGRITVFSAIDNLYKGAASQAVQNLNLMLGLPEGEGLS
ncbi:MAG: N-acetyl-gamma-glutamyl-phosphate reductase [uncultured Solirubrobacteraceae bacterium]|uniref:N-acetyl-gamma-glutamyl-phosphate reductase n=1 Tax=uncultured Solirubrobacteraceae bacterium TaxID=1162706 RepID=A0A6J4SFY0_9ACTN|nr:MAG: N-acetyl-gamma-glutamyl-phosphate reductase [uncultured Solirubrobacteraceae bacterium]